MWRLIGFIVIFAVFLAFIVFNLENKSDVSFGFYSFQDIPVFLTAFTSFVVGMIFAVPFILSFRKKRNKPVPPDQLEPPQYDDDRIDGSKKRRTPVEIPPEMNNMGF